MEAENCLSPKIATWRREFLATDKEMHQRVAILQQGAENVDFFFTIQGITKKLFVCIYYFLI